MSAKVRQASSHAGGSPLFLSDSRKDFGLSDQRNKSRTCGLIDFETVSVNPGTLADSWFVTVTGAMPSQSLIVTLSPRHYARRPEYWGIEVTACVPAVVSPNPGRFSQTIAVSDFMGTKGLEIIGARSVHLWDLP